MYDLALLSFHGYVFIHVHVSEQWESYPSSSILVITTIVKAGLYIHTITYFGCTYLVVRHTEYRFWYALMFSAAAIFYFKMPSSQTGLQ